MSQDPSLAGKVGLVVGIANERSIAHGCARVCRAAGAELALTYLNDKARPHVEPLAESLNAAVFLPCDVRAPGQLEAVFDAVAGRWGRLDFLIHAIAYATKPALQGRLVDCSWPDFAEALEVSCHSFVRMARRAEPLMRDGGSLVTLSFLGSERVVDGYQVMGPVKAALESTVRYLAAELGPAGVRVNAISPGPVATRAASGLKDFDALLDRTARRSPARERVRIDDVGAAAAFLAGDGSRLVNGQVLYVDGGASILGP